MAKPSGSDRRRHARSKIAAPVKFYHASANKGYPARCIDVSPGGMGMVVSPVAPIKAGQHVQVIAPEAQSLAEQLPPGDKIDATVARVERGALPTGGQVVVGLKIDN